jgi:GT2 family glycosyltransferase
MPIKPILSIIIVSYNVAKFIDDCLTSIIADKNLDFNNSQKNFKIPTELIIIDNASTDDSVPTIKKIISKNKTLNTKFLILNTNSGFSQANNLGAKQAQGNYLLFLNPDTIVLHSSISQTLDWFTSHPEALGCTAQLLNADKTIQPSGGFFPNLLNLLTWSTNLDDLPIINTFIKPIHPHSPNFYTHPKFYLQNHSQDWLTGAFILLRKNSFNQAGGFDPKYFMYGEELELCFRLKKTLPHQQFWYLIGPQIIHLGGGSAANRLNPLINEYLGIIAFFKKHRPSWQLPLANLLIKFNCLCHYLLYLIKKPETAKIYQQIFTKL